MLGSWAWKRAEAEIAEFFGGLRRCRVSYSESCEDIIHDSLAIEVKYGRQIPKYARVDVPTKIGPLYLIPSDYRGEPLAWVEGKRCDGKFLVDGMAQAESYNPDKLPLLCLKPRNRRGFVICFWYYDLSSFLKILRSKGQSQTVWF